MYECVHAYVHGTVRALSFNYYEMIITKYCLFVLEAISNPRLSGSSRYFTTFSICIYMVFTSICPSTRFFSLPSFLALLAFAIQNPKAPKFLL